VWNARKPSRFPDVIALPATEQEVVEAVRLARSQGFKIAVRAGGHSISGSGVRDGGMLVDLSQLTDISVDAASRSAAIQPGVTGRTLARALHDDDLAFPVGHCGSVAVGGYLLCGGIGWNMRRWGPAADSLEHIHVVTADGEPVAADPTHERDLFWAARGAGPGFFGIVTRFFVRVYPLPREIRMTRCFFRLDDVEEVSRWVADVAPLRADIVELTLLLGAAPPPAPVGRYVGVVAAAFADSAEEASDALALVETCPVLERAVVHVADVPVSFDALQDMLAARFPDQHRYAEDTLWSDTEVSVLMPLLADHIAAAPSARSQFLLYSHPFAEGTATRAVGAFSGDDTYMVADAIWEDEADDDANESWLRQAMRAVEPYATGHYIGGADLLAAPSRLTGSFSHWQALVDLKARYDPDDVFHTYLGPESANRG